MFNVIQKQLIKLILICLPNLILITLINSGIVRLTSINLPKKNLKNPVFKSTIFFLDVLLIYDIYKH